MSLRQLRDLLESVRDGRELVVIHDDGELIVVTTTQYGPHLDLLDAWRSARDECDAAYDAWCLTPGSVTYAVYQAAADRADAAQDALAANWRRSMS